jgi:hypothetical protein
MTPYPYTFGNPGDRWLTTQEAAREFRVKDIRRFLEWCRVKGVWMIRRPCGRGRALLIDKQSLAAHIEVVSGPKGTPAQRAEFERQRREEWGQRESEVSAKPLGTPEQYARFKELQQEGA